MVLQHQYNASSFWTGSPVAEHIGGAFRLKMQENRKEVAATLRSFRGLRYTRTYKIQQSDFGIKHHTNTVLL